ncbi:hypothetical protein [Thioalkalivibrio paradoxus]|uniref:Magnesium transporter MgtE intracellular domain-containing protein n=1 Tax=Thioalkalivibrio paradoxus ARh 1 TaxID=713585 RepID=W0DSK9_9GAMM|nr:hypothetical protein [Thioalkalivibrio paradoxus]AHE99973.1 hypothetical protein THITH_05290 [Thioalkalivibrio paradoxus ARh 1]
MNQLYAGTGTPAHYSAHEAVTAAPILWRDERPDAAFEVVRRALRSGEAGTGRLRLMQLTGSVQADVMRQLPLEDAAHLARGLSNYALATICERLPASTARPILRSLPDFKRQGVEMILAHRRNL